ncbi:unnamed protein product, partial [Candidula unifasciata]
YFQMPYDVIRHDMERMFRKTCDQISDSMKSCIQSVHKDHAGVQPSRSAGLHPSEKDPSIGRHLDDKAEIERLTKQVGNYKMIIQQQEDMIQNSLTSRSQTKDKSLLHESLLLREKDSFSEQRKFFTEEKAIFEKERKALKEAVACLSKEKQLLQDERAKLIKQQLLNMRPYKHSQHRRIKDGLSGRLLPATPVFSPAKTTGRVFSSETHSSGEMYQTDGLSQQHIGILGINLPRKTTQQPGAVGVGSATSCKFYATNLMPHSLDYKKKKLLIYYDFILPYFNLSAAFLLQLLAISLIAISRLSTDEKHLHCMPLV